MADFTPTLEVGSVWSDPDAFMQAVRAHNVSDGVMRPKVKKRNAQRFELACPAAVDNDSSCEFQANLRFSKKRTQWHVTQWTPVHGANCHSTTQNGHLSTKLICKPLANHAVAGTGRASVEDSIRSELKYDIQPHQLPRVMAHHNVPKSPANHAVAGSGPTLEVGSIWSDPDAFMQAVHAHNVSDGVMRPKVKKRNAQRFELACPAAVDNDSSCEFQANLRFSKKRTQWHVTQWTPVHGANCHATTHNGHLSTKLICKSLADHVVAGSGRASVEDSIRSELKYDIQPHQLSRVMAHQIRSSSPPACLESYQRLPALLDAIQAACSNTYVDIDAKLSTGAFQGVFVSLGVYREMNPKCLPVIALDGAHLKTAMRGTLLLAVQMDPERHYFPLAFCVYPGNECEDSWSWFLAHLKRALPNIAPETVFVSNREKGLLAALPNVFPHHRHRFCMDHVNKKAKSQHLSDDFRKGLYGLLHTRSEERYAAKRLELSQQFPAQQYSDFLTALPGPNFSYAFFTEHKTYGVITSNLVESANAVFRGFRDQNIDLLILGLVNWCVDKYIKHKNNGLAAEDQMVFMKRATKTYSENVNASLLLTVSVGTNYCVVRDGLLNTRVSYTEDRSDMICFCGTYRDTGMPCPHMIAVAAKIGTECKNLISPIYSIEHYRDIFNCESTFNPIDVDLSELPKSPKLSLPILKPTKGRPEAHRFVSALEKATSGRSAESSGAKRVVRCGLCHQEGHNKATCRRNLVYLGTPGSQKAKPVDS